MSAGHDGMTRRDFAKTAAAAASFAILSSRGAAAQANTETLKVGLIGCGGRGTGAVPAPRLRCGAARSTLRAISNQEAAPFL